MAFSKYHRLAGLSAWLLASAVQAYEQSPSPLNTGFGKNGPASLKYHGTELLKRGDPWVNLYVPITPDGPKSMPPGDCETSFNAVTRTETAKYSWGDIVCIYKPEKNRLGIQLTITNRSPQPVWKLSVTLLELKFPTPFSGAASDDLTSDSIDNVPVLLADYGTGTLAYTGSTFSEDYIIELDRMRGDEPNAWYLKLGTDSKRTTDREHLDMPLPPGASKTYSLSLRFAPGGGTLRGMAGDLFTSYANKYPPALKWPDRRPISMIFRSSPADQHHSPMNPRGWFNNPNLDLVSEKGRARFRKMMLKAADTDIRSLRSMNAQGMIFWDVEGEEQPHPVTYIGDPRMTAKLAPEMDAVADEYFKKYIDAGFRTGICIRPSRIDLSTGADGRAKASHRHMKFDPVEEMSAKIDYARKRWGCTIFYMDTNATWAYSPEKEKDGSPVVVSWTMRADMIRRLAAKHPDVLILPEFQYPGYFSHTSGYRELSGGHVSTAGSVLLDYPGAFTVLKMDDEKKIDQHHAELVASVRRGDILLYPGWYDSPINRKVKAIYNEAMKNR